MMRAIAHTTRDANTAYTFQYSSVEHTRVLVQLLAITHCMHANTVYTVTGSQYI
jgi:hypothetical protein